MVNLINIFVKNKNLSYSNLGKARSYSYDGLGNRMGIKEYERKIGYGEDGLKIILEENLSELTPSYEESYILDRTRVYHNLLQNKTIKRGSQAIQSYIWDFNVAYMEEGEKEFTYLQDELGSTIRLLEQGGESQAVYGYDEFGEDTYNTQGQIQPFGYTGYRYDNVANTYFAQAREYVPGVGRFAGEDWIKGKIYYPQTINVYLYCLANSLKFYDPTGLDCYVFYDETNFSRQAADEASRISNYWRTKVNLISVDSNKDFQEVWNKIEDGNVEEISLLFHGQPQALIINEGENSFLTISDEVYSWDGSIVYNKTFGFRDIGFGGYIPVLAKNQEYFKSWIKSDKKRKPFGRIVYTWDKDKMDIIVSTAYVGDRIHLKYPMCDETD